MNKPNKHSQCDIYSGARFVPDKAWHKTITYINAPAVGVIRRNPMKAKFYLDGGQPKVEIDNEWNALSLFLESDSSFEDVVRHLELKKQRRWMGNTSVIRHISGSKYQVSTELDVNIKSVELSQSQLLKLIEAWHDFNNNRIDCIVSV